MAQAVGKVQDGVMSGALCLDDVSANDIEQHLYTEVFKITHLIESPSPRCF